MVPTLLLLGLLLGRWWRTTLLIAVVGWPLLLLVDGAIDPGWGLAGAAGVAAVNTGIGVLVHQALSWCVRRLRHTPASR
jgi:hypothetical protein